MLIEQIIEFELRGLGPSGRTICTCAHITGYFHDKTKISKVKSSSGLLFTAKYCTRPNNLSLPTWAKHLKNVTPKCKILNVFWT